MIDIDTISAISTEGQVPRDADVMDAGAANDGGGRAALPRPGDVLAHELRDPDAYSP